MRYDVDPAVAKTIGDWLMKHLAKDTSTDSTKPNVVLANNEIST